MKLRTVFSMGGWLIVLGCQEMTVRPPSSESPREQRENLKPSKNELASVVHEWGTFTSMSGSDGKLLEGMHHEEEPLPEFVYGRNTERNRAQRGHEKGMESETGVAIEQVTQKLETPVIYFYGPTAQAAKVIVDFPDGVISEWFPQATSSFPEIGRRNLLKNGRMEWEVTFDASPRHFPSVPNEHLWAHSRRVASLPLRVGQEHEQFIFYRGLGRFETPFRVTSRLGGQLNLENTSKQNISAAFLLSVSEAGGTLRELGAVPANSTRTDVFLPRGGKEFPMGRFVEETETRVARALVESGLYEDEAQAMVKTWSHSYFRTPGIRILYVVPREWTDALLPISIQPSPQSLVRVLVGRAEVLTVEEENEIVARAERAAADNVSSGEFVQLLLSDLNRFAEPKIRRALALEPSPKAAKLLGAALSQMSGLP